MAGLATKIVDNGESFREGEQACGSNAPAGAPIFYIAVAGNAAQCLKDWADGAEDARSLATTYSFQFFELCRRLGRPGIVSFPGEPRSALTANGISAIPRPHRKMRAGILFHLQRVRHGLALLRQVVRSGARDVILMDGVTYFACIAPARLFGVRLHMSFHTELLGPRSKVQKFVWWLDGWAMRRFCAGYLAVSPVVADQIRVVTGDRASPIHLFHGTYSQRLFDSFEAKLSTGRPFRVYFGGRVEPEKGVFDLLETAELLQRDDYDVHFDVCGTGGSLEALREQVSARGLADRVHVHGNCSRDVLLGHLEACDAVIVPTRTSFREGLNKALAEASLSCRPAVTSEICLRGAGLHEAAVEAVPDDPASYAEAIKMLIDDPQLYRAKAEAACRLRRRFIGEEESWQNAALRMMQPSLQERPRQSQ